MLKSKVNQHEIRAIELMSTTLGEYVDKRIGSTDFATWTPQQWFDFLRRSTIEFSDAMRVVTADLAQ